MLFVKHIKCWLFYRITVKELLPKENSWDKTADKVRDKLCETIMKQIRDWERQNIDNELLKRIQAVNEKELPTFISAIDDLEKEMAGRPEDNKDILYFVNDTFTVMSGFLQSIAKLHVSLIWFVERLTYSGYMHVKRFIGVQSLSDEYNLASSDAEKINVCTKYAEKEYNCFTERRVLERMVKEDLMIISDLLDKEEENIKHQLEVDTCLLKQLEADSRDAKTVKMFYEPLQNKVEMMIRHLCYFLTMHFPNIFTNLQCITTNNVKVTDTVVCSGVQAEIRLGEGKFTEAHEFRQLCVRVQKKKVQITDIERYKDILQEYR